MRQRVLFLTGRLAEPRLRQVLAAMEEDGLDWEVRDIGIQVAALMTPDLIRRRVPRESVEADRVLVPGYCRGDLEALSAEPEFQSSAAPKICTTSLRISAGRGSASTSRVMPSGSSPRSSMRRQ